MRTEARSSIETVRAAFASLNEADLAALSDVECLEALRALGAVVNMAQAQLTRLAGHVHRSGAALADGATSTPAWLRSRLHTADAGRYVRAGKALASAPEVEAAFARGDISLAHVVSVASVVDDIPPDLLGGGVDKLLAEQAAAHTPQVFARAVERIRDHFSPDAAERKRRDQYSDRWLQVDVTFEGSVAVRGVLDPDAGELLITTLNALMPPPSADDPRSTAQRRADALTELCRSAATPSSGPSRPTVVMTVDLESIRPVPLRSSPLDSDGRWRGASLGSGMPIGAETARRLACDASIIPIVLGGRGQPLDIGRATRVVPAAMRRALIARDGRCRFPGCSRCPEWTDGHHLVPWSAGGVTALHNLILLCRFHHTLVHEGGFAIRLDDDTGNVHATYPDGRAYDLISPPRAMLP